MANLHKGESGSVERLNLRMRVEAACALAILEEAGVDKDPFVMAARVVLAETGGELLLRDEVLSVQGDNVQLVLDGLAEVASGERVIDGADPKVAAMTLDSTEIGLGEAYARHYLRAA